MKKPLSDERLNAQGAARLVERMIPQPRDRLLIMARLLRSIGIANRLGARSWSVTLFQDGFRLNVGRGEVMCFEEKREEPPRKVPGLCLLLHGESGRASILPQGRSEARSVITPANYEGVPQPQSRYDFLPLSIATGLSDDEYAQLCDELERLCDAHDRYVSFAATSCKTEPETLSNYQKSHSPGLYEYAKSLLAQHNAQRLLEPQLPPDAENVAPEDSEAKFLEGAIASFQTSRRERNPKARKQCLDHHGHSCVVCGLDLRQVYGKVAQGVIHVHHLMPLSDAGQQRPVDGVADLRPVCPNCHVVIHLRKPPYTVEEVRGMRSSAEKAARLQAP